MEKNKRFTLATKEGATRLFVLFLVLILVSSLFAQLISSDFGKVKISSISMDVRGARLDADLYYPVGINGDEQIPAIVVNHGGACAKNVIRGVAEELARRGFVVLNVNAYGSGTSETPAQKEESTCIQDAVDYLRSLTFVDTTRIAVVGHSAGSSRVGSAAMNDAGAYTLNDLLINELYNTYGVQIKESEVNTDADSLAKAYLNSDQLKSYKLAEEEISEKYNSRIKAVCIMGTSGKSISILNEVNVAGFTVYRNYQFNLCVIDGEFDPSRVEFPTKDYAKQCWYTGDNDISKDAWYVLDDTSASSQVIGDFSNDNILNNPALAQSFSNRTVRVFTTNPETHSKNFFSVAAASDVVKFCTQALNYNNGNLDSTTSAVGDDSVVYLWREVFNCISMLSMIGMLLSLAALLTKKSYFADCVVSESKDELVFKKSSYWIVNVLVVVVTFLAIYFANNAESGPKHLLIKESAVFPLGFAADTALKFMVALALFALTILIVLFFVDKKNKINSLDRINLKISGKSLLKDLLLCVILIAVGYLSLTVISYLFNQEYRLWSMSFSVMKNEYWISMIPYTLLTLPIYFILSSLTNFTIRKDLAPWKDDLITVIVSSAGVWLCAIINILVAKTSYDGSLFASFIMTYSTLIFVPIITIVNRLSYRITKSIWLGAILSAMLFAWSTISYAGIGAYTQSIISMFMGF